MKHPFVLTALFVVAVFSGIQLSESLHDSVESHNKVHFDGPAEFARFHRQIRTRDGEDKPAYSPGYRMREAIQSRAKKRKSAREANGVVEWVERGPANVPGRTRGLVVDPDDPARETWYAGSVSGGVWKTTNSGSSWNLITPDLPNLATSVIVMAQSDHNVMYVGTGEGFFNIDAVTGSGIFKSTDRGITWNYLTSTNLFGDVNRMAIAPDNADVVVAASATGIYRTVNGGDTWTNVLEISGVQDLKVNPVDFQIQYATVNGSGIYKSLDGGQSWSSIASSQLLGGASRIEVAISPVNTNRIFASVDVNFGDNSILFTSTNAGNTWSQVNVSINGSTVDFLNGQGWYDNTIMCDPFDETAVYFGGVDLFRLKLSAGSTLIETYSLEEQNTQLILSLVNFVGSTNGTFDVGTPNGISVELRFGPGRSQQAHRFMVPAGQGAGVPVSDYAYQDYVTVPFEVWDITNNRQLMASFRDQGRDGGFNLIPNNTTATDVTQQSREYLYIHNIDYSSTSPSTLLTKSGGQEVSLMYNIWPTLAAGGVWPPTIQGSLFFKYLAQEKINAATTFITDGRNQFGDPGKNSNVHVDHHNLVAIPMSGSTFKILNANDGGVFISNTAAIPGVNNGNWTFAGVRYNTSQFYGADKKPGANEYLGGMQDNGTWRSAPGVNAVATTNYLFNIGGDGFEVIWNNLNEQLLIGGYQGNGFQRSVDGGNTWFNAVSGLTGEFPFISKLANSKYLPDRIFAVGSAGVFVSQNFGLNWVRTPISDKWGTGAPSSLDVEVSRANANIVWAGSGMTATRNLHVSINGGQSFSPANNFSEVTLGSISKLASHPVEENTAYALFSFADAPKVLRTTNLGQSWQDISGFGSGNESLTGFPDVAVYCLYVRPDNPNIIWVGTEIGIVESLDNGATWSLLDEFPNVSVWDMKGQDNQVVIATHGRGIWTAQLNASQLTVKVPEIVDFGTSPKEELLLRINSTEFFDKLEVYQETTLLGSFTGIEPATYTVTLTGIAPGTKNIKMLAYKGTAPFQSKTYIVDQLDMLSVEDSYATNFNTTDDLILSRFFWQRFTGQSVSERRTLHTAHNYVDNRNSFFLIRHPVKVGTSFPIIQYEDIAIVEPGLDGAPFSSPDFKDYVVLEASKNGLDWISVEDGYDARANADWLNAFNTGSVGTTAMFLNHEINLLDSFNAGDTLLFRYRLFADAAINSWGAAVNFISIQQEPTGIIASEISKQLKISPNPSRGVFVLEYELAAPSEVLVDMSDMSGRSLMSMKLGQQAAGIHKQAIDVTELSNGPYLAIVRTKKGRRTARVLIVR